jgi:hypothetical protein
MDRQEIHDKAMATLNLGAWKDERPIFERMSERTRAERAARASETIYLLIDLGLLNEATV